MVCFVFMKYLKQSNQYISCYFTCKYSLPGNFQQNMCCKTIRSHQKELKYLLEYIQSWYSIEKDFWALKAKFSSMSERRLNWKKNKRKSRDWKSHLTRAPWLLVGYCPKNQTALKILFKDKWQKLLKVTKWKFLQSLKASANDRTDFCIALLIQGKILRGKRASRCLYIHFEITTNSVK